MEAEAVNHGQTTINQTSVVGYGPKLRSYTVTAAIRTAVPSQSTIRALRSICSYSSRRKRTDQ